jgi:hypothetical protein
MKEKICVTLALLSFLLPTFALGDGHDDSSPEALAFVGAACALRDGKDQNDANKVVDALTSWSKENHPGILSVLTPKYAFGSSQDMLFFSWMPFEALGSFDNALSNDFVKEQKLLMDTMDCGSFAGGWYNMHLPESVSEANYPMVMITSCIAVEGMSTEAVGAAFNKAGKTMNENNSLNSLSVMDHGPGTREFPGDFTVFQAYPDAGAVASEFNRYWNEDGWKENEVFQSNVATCEKPNMYSAQVLHRVAE